ncbi:MAG: hypothetical protein ACLVAA_10070 [Ruthenibacterium sp.]
MAQRLGKAGPERYFAYIYKKEGCGPVGEVHYCPDGGIHSMGILIQEKYRGRQRIYSVPALFILERVTFEKTASPNYPILSPSTGTEQYVRSKNRLCAHRQDAQGTCIWRSPHCKASAYHNRDVCRLQGNRLPLRQGMMQI